MTRKLGFYNRDGLWYADLPDYIEAGGEEADCLMVSGADTWLDKLSGDKDRVTLFIGTDNPLKEVLTKTSGDGYGANYIAETYEGEEVNHKLWICPVTLHVFGEYPEKIYYQVVKDSDLVQPVDDQEQEEEDWSADFEGPFLGSEHS